MRRRRVLPLFCLALVPASMAASPAAEFLYPSGADAPVNTKVLVRLACCGYSDKTVTVATGGVAVSGRMAYAVDQWVVFTPDHPFSPHTAYTVTVAVSGHDLFTGTFTTGGAFDLRLPTVASTSPSNNQDGWFPDQPVRIVFSEPINPQSVVAGPPVVTEFSSGDSFYGTSWTMKDERTLLINAQFAPGRVYRIRFPKSLPEDMAGNVMSVPGPDLMFTTYPEAPKNGPRLSGSIPAEGETGAPTNIALFLLFDKPPIVPADGVFSLSSSGDPQVPIKVEAVQGVNALIVRPQLLLRANQDYTLRSSGLYDQFGGRLSNPTLLRFRTGVIPELHTFQAVSGPVDQTPSVKRLKWRYSRALNPFQIPKLTRMGTTAWPAIAYDTRLLADGVTLEADIPGPGVYSLSPVFDRIESRGNSDRHDVTVLADEDQRGPTALAVFPPDKSVGAPLEVKPAVVFDEWPAPFAADQVRLWRGGEQIPADLAVSSNALIISPQSPLADNTDYRVEVRGPRDAAGNAGADVQWVFHVVAKQPTEPFQTLRAEPADNATKVAADSVLAVTFNRPPNPVTLYSDYQWPVKAAFGPVRGSWRLDGNRAIFRPDGGAFPAGRVNWSLNVSDFGGNRPAPGAYGSFWVADSGAAAPALRVVKVSPAEGGSCISGDRAITLEFNQPVRANTVTQESIAVLLNGRSIAVQMQYDAARNRVQISTERTDGWVSVVASPAIRSVAGAALEPFSANIRLVNNLYSQAPVQAPFIRSVIPNSSLPVRANSPLIVFFSQPMDRTLTERGLRVEAGGAAIPGRIEWSPDSTALTFYPLAPLPVPANGFLMLSLVPWGRAGAESQSFSTRVDDEARPFRWNVLGSFGYMPTDGVVDIEFDRDQPKDFVRSATATPNRGSAMKLQVTARSSRVFRMRAPQPFDPATPYWIAVDAPGYQYTSMSVTTYSFATPKSRRLAVGPTDAMGETPVNAVIWVEAQAPLNPISLKTRLTCDGAEVPFTADFQDAGFRLLLHPLGLLRGKATYKVMLTGIEDMAGKAIPDLTWTFHTGAGPDAVPARLISWTPTGTADPNSALRLTYDKPVFFVRERASEGLKNPYDFTVWTSNATVSGQIDVSADGRTLSHVPNRAWPADTQIDLNAYRQAYFDWTSQLADAGQDQYGNRRIVGFVSGPASAAAPQLEAVNPIADAQDAPLNVRVQARYADAVLGTSLGRVRLEADGAAVPARAALEADGRTVTLVPERALQPARRYTVTLEGVQNVKGIARSSADKWSFRTASSFEAGTVRALVFPEFTKPFRIRIDAPRPVNPMSINPAKFFLTVRGSVQIAADVRLEADGRSIRVTPRVPPPANTRCDLRVEDLTDWAGNAISAGLSFNTGDLSARDSAAPRVRTLYPHAGAAVNWNTVAAAVFDEAVYLRDGEDGVHITSRGRPVAAALEPAYGASVVAVRPENGWMPGESYDVEIDGVLDLSGNAAAPVKWSFKISAEGAAQFAIPELTSSSPAQYAVGVRGDAEIVLEYSQPVLPLGGDFTYDRSSITTQTGERIPFREIYEEKRLRLAPIGGLPAGNKLYVSARVLSLTGVLVSTYVGFTTAASSDTTPPRLESVSPAQGSRLFAGTNQFVLRFSEPITRSGDPISFVVAGQKIGPNETSFPIEGDGRTLIATFTLPADGAGTLVPQAGITDLSGNPFAPVALAYTIAPAGDSYNPQVTWVQPADGSIDIPLDAVIELQFTQAMNKEALQAALEVLDDGYAAPVSLTGDKDGRKWRITPSTKWLPDTMVVVNVSMSAFGVSGARLTWPFHSQFRTARAAAPTAGVNSITGVEAHVDGVDVRFEFPLSDAPDECFGLRLGQTRISAVVEKRGERWLRVVPDAPLDAALNYHLMAGRGVEIPVRIKTTPQVEREAPPAAVDDTGAIRIPLDGTLHPFSLGRPNVILSDDKGRNVPYHARVTTDGRTLIIEPLGAANGVRVRIGGKVLDVPAPTR